MVLDLDFSHYSKHGDGERKQGNNFYQDIGTIDYRDFEQLQNSHSLYMILTPPMDLNGLGNSFSKNYERDSSNFLSKTSDAFGNVIDFIGGSACNLFSDLEDQTNLNVMLDYYQKHLISGHLMKCSSLLEGIAGLKNLGIQTEKVIENNVGKGLSLPVARTKGDETEMTLSFNETTDLDVFNTFFTIMSYQRSVIEGNRSPLDEFVYNGIIDYMFQIYVVNFDKTGQRVLSTVKLSNITLTNVSAETLESNLDSGEHKKTTITIAVSDFIYNNFGIFKELEDYGVLPRDKYVFNERNKYLEYGDGKSGYLGRDFKSEVSGYSNSSSNFSGSSLIRDVGRTLFPAVGTTIDHVFNNDECASNASKLASIGSLTSGLGGLL